MNIVLLHFVGSKHVFVPVWPDPQAGGRRKLPQAVEVRRPPGPAWVRRWRYRFMNTVLEEHDGKRQEEQGGWAAPKYQPPPVPGPLFAAGNSKGAGGTHSFQPPPPPGPLLRYLSSEMGGPGAGGRTCEIMLWCRRGRNLSKIMLSLAPEHDFHTSCAQSRQGRSGASGPGVRNGALV